MKIVVAAIIVKDMPVGGIKGLHADSLVLIAKRGINDKLANKWEFPGGKIEEGETPEVCLVREIQEELNIDIVVDSYFGETGHSYDHGAIHLIAYLVHYEGGEVTLHVHDDFKWVPIELLHTYDFAPADIPLVRKLEESSK